MNELCRVALEVQSECEKHQWRFCFIGGLAVQNWGEPRFTRDVDLTLLTGFGNEEAFIDPLLNAFAPRMEWATGDRHFLLHTMKRRPYEELQRIVEEEGGRMFHEKAGHRQGGAWVVMLNGVTKVFESNQAGFPGMDELYVPKVPAPKHYRDYETSLLIAGAREKWLKSLAAVS